MEKGNDKRIKCTACKRVKFEEDFLKHQKILKTCIACRDKNAKKLTKENEPPIVIQNEVPVPVEVPIEVPIEPILIPIEQLAQVPVEVPIEVPADPIVIPAKIKRWIGISGYWIHPGDERSLHKKLLRKVHNQFHQQSAFSVHKYLTRWVMVDIRDHLQ
jgi:ribosomal protein L35